MTAGALHGVRVLDTSGHVGVYCARVLADLGADVIVVEPPGGERLRRLPPFRNEAPDSDGLPHSYFRAGQRATVLDLDIEPGRSALERLGSAADVVLISPSAHRPLPGWDPDRLALCWGAPAAVVCALTPFGLTGPHRDWRATSLTSFAMGGTMVRYGPLEGPPSAMPGRQQWYEAGAHAALAVLAALYGPRPSGRLIDLAVHEVAVLRDFLIERYSAQGLDPGGRLIPVGIPPSGMHPCSDGPLDVACHRPRHWQAFLEMLDYPDELSEPSLADPMMRRAIFDGLIDIMEKLTADRSRAELVQRGQRAGLPCSSQNTPTQFVADPQIVARGTFVDTPMSAGGAVPMPGPGFRSSPALTVERASRPPAPHAAGPGQAEWHVKGAKATFERHSGVGEGPGSAPLAGVRILGLGAFIAGPLAGALLAELGAEVVKIEPRSRPEVLRTEAYALGASALEPSGVPTTVMFSSINRNVRNLALEMDSEEGRRLFRRLVAEADVLIENFAAGVMDRWGLGPDRLLEINPRLVVTSLSGYGRTGPRATYLAYGSNIANFSSFSQVWGRSHPTHADYIGAEHAALATVAALHAGRATSRGTFVDVAQFEALAAVMPEVFLDASVNGRDTEPPGDPAPGSLLWGVFGALGHDSWVAVELEDRADWEKLGRILERAGLSPDDAADREEMVKALTDWCAEKTGHTAAHLLQRAGVAAGVAQSTEDLWRDPQLRERGYLPELDHPDLGVMTYVGNPYRFDGKPVAVPRTAARLGGDTRAVLGEWLALGDAEIDALVAAGVVFAAA